MGILVVHNNEFGATMPKDIGHFSVSETSVDRTDDCMGCEDAMMGLYETVRRGVGEELA